MGILSKLMFWKKDDSMGDMGDMGDMGGMGDMGNMDLGIPGDDRLGLPKDMESGGMPKQGPEQMGSPQSFSPPKLEPVAQQQPSQPSQPSYMQAPSSAGSKDLELISVKIDQLRTSLDILNQRLSNIERMLENQHGSKW